jgi:hypothetical protein
MTEGSRKPFCRATIGVCLGDAGAYLLEPRSKAISAVSSPRLVGPMTSYSSCTVKPDNFANAGILSEVQDIVRLFRRFSPALMLS